MAGMRGNMGTALVAAAILSGCGVSFSSGNAAENQVNAVSEANGWALEDVKCPKPRQVEGEAVRCTAADNSGSVDLMVTLSDCGQREIRDSDRMSNQCGRADVQRQ